MGHNHTSCVALPHQALDGYDLPWLQCGWPAREICCSISHMPSLAARGSSRKAQAGVDLIGVCCCPCCAALSCLQHNTCPVCRYELEPDSTTLPAAGDASAAGLAAALATTGTPALAGLQVRDIARVCCHRTGQGCQVSGCWVGELCAPAVHLCDCWAATLCVVQPALLLLCLPVALPCAAVPPCLTC
jgi:hypothetical protein